MKKVILTILSAKVCIFLLGIMAFYLLPYSQAGYFFNFHYPQNAPFTLQTAFSTWDAQHYLFLAQKGYHIGQESNRFYPLLPSLIRLFSPLFGFFFSGLFVTNIISFIGFIYFYLFVKHITKNEETAYKSLLTLLVFPTSFYFSLIYSESIFLGLVMPLLYYLYKKRFLYVSLFAFLLPLLRPTGDFIEAPLLIFVLMDCGKQVKQSSAHVWQTVLHWRWSVLLILPALAGFGLYLFIMYHTTGNALTGFVGDNMVVGGWKVSNLWHPWIFLGQLFTSRLALHGFTNSIIDRVFFIGFVGLLPLVWKKTDPVLFIYTCCMGLVPLFGNFMSYTRYVLLAFPIFIVLGVFFSQKNKKDLFFIYMYASLLLQSLFIVMHVLNYWVA